MNSYISINTYIHRHTGGLESYYEELAELEAIHRHTGGLERPYQLRQGGFLYSPPHRRLRK